MRQSASTGPGLITEKDLAMSLEIFGWVRYPFSIIINKGARWRSGRASDSESRGQWFHPRRQHRVVSLSKAH